MFGRKTPVTSPDRSAQVYLRNSTRELVGPIGWIDIDVEELADQEEVEINALIHNRTISLSVRVECLNLPGETVRQTAGALWPPYAVVDYSDEMDVYTIQWRTVVIEMVDLGALLNSPHFDPA